MTRLFKTFLKKEDGAALVDVTMLLAAGLGLGLAAMATVSLVSGGAQGNQSATMAQHTTQPTL
ncbi:hypothetical protein [Litoreibacter albidus]|uniref:Flp pilus assembly protein, pilin Flp n=1 Tax=Litoreibacter albidus TaxID=670155 RepID=A0A1H2ZA62_9RHOB|nr:hypothetical protein [Litoreibacter albidus]SDX14393.1 hypothetical protein SAMN04488001_2499 [Litoreibacter albidus]